MTRSRDPQIAAPLEHTKGTGRCLCNCICGAPVDVCPKCHRKSLHTLPGGEKVCEFGAHCADQVRGSSEAERRAHNPKYVGSNPTPATNPERA